MYENFRVLFPDDGGTEERSGGLLQRSFGTGMADSRRAESRTSGAGRDHGGLQLWAGEGKTAAGTVEIKTRESGSGADRARSIQGAA